jgi:hypothetical protein
MQLIAPTQEWAAHGSSGLFDVGNPWFSASVFHYCGQCLVVQEWDTQVVDLFKSIQ